MYRPLLRQQPWTASGYVCRQCRHHLAAAQRQQARHAGTTPYEEADETDGQDWANNFNFISDDLPTPKTFPVTEPENDASLDVTRAGVTGRKKSTSSARRRKRKRLEISIGERAAEIRRERARTQQRSAAVVKSSSASARLTGPESGFGGLKSSLAGRVEGETGDRPEPQQKAVGQRKPKLFKDRQSERLANFAKKESRHRQPGQGSERDGNIIDGAERQTFENLLAGLCEGLPDAEARETRTKALDRGTKVADDVYVPAGVVSGEEGMAIPSTHEEPPQRVTTPQFSSNPAAYRPRAKRSPSQHTWPADNGSRDSEQPEDTMLGVDSGREHAGFVRPTFISNPSRKPPSLAARVQEAKDRQKWGGYPSPVTNGTGNTGKLSFDVLRAADKVSPERVVVTAGETKAWGAEAVVAQAAKSGEIAGARGRKGKVAAEEPATAVGKFSSIFSLTETFATLKQTLGGRVKKEDDAAESGHAPMEVETGMLAAKVSYVASERKDTKENKPMAEKQPRLGGRHRTRLRRCASSEEIMAILAGQEQETSQTELSDKTQDDAFARLSNLHASKGKESQEGSPTLTPDGKPLTGELRGGLEEPIDSIPGQSTVGVGDEELHRDLAEVMSSPAAAPLGEVATAPMSELEPMSDPEPMPEVDFTDIKSISAGDLQVIPLNVAQPPVPPLQYGLDRALFNSGVYQLQDPHSRVFNFDPYLQNVLPIAEFDFNALKEYKTSSEDSALSDIAKELGKKYVGSTSSMTGTLAHFHYLLSNWRGLNLNMLSRAFPEQTKTFTSINRVPSAIFLRWKNGTYAIDADKEHDTPNVLMMLGKSMEKLLTLPREEYERYRKSNSINPITAEEKDTPESYEYTTMDDFLMRSQLDAYDSRLPGTGMFDLKTRAVVSIRMDAKNYTDMLGYEIHTLQGNYESYEREYYDMLRSTMLKYLLQARMGRMDGIFVAYHNVQRIFGFQYISIAEMDRAIHGQVDPCLGDQEFRASLKLLNEALDMATKKFPEQSLRVHVESSETPTSMMWIFAEPVTEGEVDAIQSLGKDKAAKFEKEVMGLEDAKPAATKSAVESSETPSSPGDSGEEIEEIESPDYMSTTTPADRVFIERIGTNPSPEETHKPLFAATIICQNFLDGKPAETENRVHNLKRDENWEIQYILKETTLGPAERWARYEDLKQRRRAKFTKDTEAEGVQETPKRKKAGGERSYLDQLKEMSQKGREFRSQIEVLEAESEKVVLGMSPSAKAVEAVEAADELDDLDDVELPSVAEATEVAEEEADAVATEDGVTAVTTSGEVLEAEGDVAGYMRWLYQQQPERPAE
ncbi:hypothetical protein LTR08_008110 [Meristemomyces frigidus]|nr:hypothetical protein LTR08_008110 [Meristemomyces frigidus]